MNAAMRFYAVLTLAVMGCGSESEPPAAIGSKSTDTHPVDRATTGKSPFDATTSGVNEVQQPKVVTPNAAVVKKHMTPNQLALGDPVVNSIGMLLVPIPAGDFLMGSRDSDKDANDNEKPRHLVKITKPFYMSVFEVTQQQYEKIMEVRPWEGKENVREGPDYPATYVNWHDAMEFCRKLSEKEGVEYRLPTEAEWEYTCRAGTTTVFSFGDDDSQVGEHAWCFEHAGGLNEEYAHRVGQKLPNPWGLYDMHGNVWEWCQDGYERYYSEKSLTDPMGPAQGNSPVLRGGAFNLYPRSVRSALRNGNRPHSRELSVGFRPARIYNLSP